MHDHNVKMRDGAVDIKRLVARRDGLEQWKPVVKKRFPLSLEFVVETLIPIFSSPDFDFSASRAEYTAAAVVSYRRSACCTNARWALEDSNL